MAEMIRPSFEKMAFLGEKARDARFVSRVDATKDKLNFVLNPTDSVTRAEINGNVSDVVRGLAGRGEWQCDTVMSLIDTVNDPTRSVNRDVAIERLDVLASSTYIVMTHGENEDLRQAVGTKDGAVIDAALPESLRGIGGRVAEIATEQEITNPKLKDALKKLNRRADVLRTSGTVGKEKLRELIGEKILELSDLVDELDERGYDELTRVSAYLGAEAARLVEKDEGKNIETVGDGKDGNSLVVEYLRQNAEYARASAEYARKKGILESEVEQVSLGELLDSYLRIRAPRERAPQMWEYEVPEFMGNMSLETWRKLLSYEDGWVGAIYDKRGDVAYNNMIDKMIQGILGKKSLEEGDLKEWYEDETLNLRGVMHQISKELLVERRVTAVVPKENGQGFEEVVRTIYVFDTERDEKGKERYIRHSRVEEFVDNEVGYKMALAERLVRRGVVVNIEVAKLSVALAMDIMEMGGVFSGADVLRRLSWESDVVRLSQKPDRKFTPKVSSGELFAGPWTELANTLSRNDSKKAAEMIKSWGVVPELLAGSFLDQKLKKADGSYTDQTMMFMIYHNKKIPFRDIGNDLFFGWRKDHIQPAARTWMYIANKNPLEFSKNRENDTVISQWRADLYNDVNQLRRNEDCLLTTSVIEGMIGGSVGLWPFEGPYLRVAGSSHGNRVIDSFEATTEIVRQLGLSKIETDIILKFFGVDNANFNDLNEKMVAYDAIRNVTLPKWYIKKSEERLFKKRQH